ncbi:NAD-dependent alcohol dehydrogenase, partial [Armadillidium nasatum]
WNQLSCFLREISPVRKENSRSEQFRSRFIAYSLVRNGSQNIYLSITEKRIHLPSNFFVYAKTCLQLFLQTKTAAGTSANRSEGSSTGGAPTDEMPNRTLVTQVSIESPSARLRDAIFNFESPMPTIPPKGARIKQEVVDSVGEEARSEISVGDRVIVYPYEGHPPGYAEYIAVPDVEYLVKIPDEMSLSVAAMLPSGALWAINTVFHAQKHVESVLREKGESGICKLLLVGTGGLALWAMRIARYYWPTDREKLKIVVACIRDEGISIAIDELKVNMVRWNEDLYEEQLVERTKNACEGPVDIVIDFNATSRSIRRALKCLAKNGVLLMSSEHAENLLKRFSLEAERENHELIPVELGSLNQLKNLVHLVANGEIEPPPHHIFPADNANEALSKIGRGQIHGRAILEFPEEDEE